MLYFAITSQMQASYVLEEVDTYYCKVPFKEGNKGTVALREVEVFD